MLVVDDCLLACHFPDDNAVLIQSGGGNLCALRRPCQGGDTMSMPLITFEEVATDWFPELDGGICTARGQCLPIGRPRERADGFTMPGILLCKFTIQGIPDMN